MEPSPARRARARRPGAGVAERRTSFHAGRSSHYQAHRRRRAFACACESHRPVTPRLGPVDRSAPSNRQSTARRRADGAAAASPHGPCQRSSQGDPGPRMRNEPSTSCATPMPPRGQTSAAVGSAAGGRARSPRVGYGRCDGAAGYAGGQRVTSGAAGTRGGAAGRFRSSSSSTSTAFSRLGSPPAIRASGRSTTSMSGGTPSFSTTHRLAAS